MRGHLNSYRVGAKKRLARKAEQRKINSRRGPVAVIVLLLIASVSVTAYLSQPTPPASKKIEVLPKRIPRNLVELVAMKPEDIEGLDIARMNLLSAMALPGSENLNVDEALAQLDRWAAHIKAETDRNYHRFKENPAEFENSEAYYRMMMMAVVMQEDAGIKYDRSQIIPREEFGGPKDTFYDDSRNQFVHGITERQMGTCASLPVFYVALGRRLGYPMKLVAAKNHFFARWDDGRTKLNFECTSPGFATYPDDYYRKWPEEIYPREMGFGHYLKSLNPSEELAAFLNMRGIEWYYHQNIPEAASAFKAALKLNPTSTFQKMVTASYTRRMQKYLMWEGEQKAAEMMRRRLNMDGSPIGHSAPGNRPSSPWADIPLPSAPIMLPSPLETAKSMQPNGSKTPSRALSPAGAR